MFSVLSRADVGEVVFIENESVAGVETSRCDGAGLRTLVLCDHATSRVPAAFGTVDERILLDHYGWDLGALCVARVLSEELRLPLIRSNFSRLLIDPNRGEDAKDLIRDDLLLPLNERLDSEKRKQRLALFYAPYHREIEDFLDRRFERGDSIEFIISVHTFTPRLSDEVRVWETGLIYDVSSVEDSDCARFFMGFLRDAGYCVGDNEPYPPLRGDSLARHASKRGIVSIGIEIRNNLVLDSQGQEKWGALLARAVEGWRSGAGSS